MAVPERIAVRPGVRAVSRARRFAAIAVRHAAVEELAGRVEHAKAHCQGILDALGDFGDDRRPALLAVLAARRAVADIVDDPADAWLGVFCGHGFLQLDDRGRQHPRLLPRCSNPSYCSHAVSRDGLAFGSAGRGTGTISAMTSQNLWLLALTSWLTQKIANPARIKGIANRTTTARLTRRDRPRCPCSPCAPFAPRGPAASLSSASPLTSDTRLM